MKLILSLFLLFVCAISSALADVVINEVQSSNDQTFVDDRGDEPDWVEFYNDSEEPVDLGGWGFSDNLSKPFKWTFPTDTIILGKGFLVVCADGDVFKRGGLHATFSLSASGETLVLTRPNGEVADTIEFGKIPCDSSFGRTTSGSLGWFAEPTPGSANEVSVYGEPLSGVTFSLPHGLYNEAQEVYLDHEDSEAKIFYTLDFSEPTEEKGFAYTRGTPIRISSTTTIRATAKKVGSLPYRNVSTHTYLYLNDVANQEKPPYAGDVWSDAGSTPASYGISKSVVKSEADEAALVAALKAAPVVSLTVDGYDMWNETSGLHSKPSSLDGYEIPVGVEILSGRGDICLEAGLRMQGHGSRMFSYNPKKSFRICFRGRYGASTLKAPLFANQGAEVAEFKTLVLRGGNNNEWTSVFEQQRTRGTHLRDPFVRELQIQASGFGARSEAVHVFINGLYWGVYDLAERPDAAMGASLWGGEKEEYDSVKNYETNGSIEVRDGTEESYLKMLEVVKSNSYDEPNGRAKIDEVLDVKAFIDYMIINYWCGNSDWPANNWIAVGSESQHQPWRYFVWDAETTFQSNYASEDRIGYTSTGKGQTPQDVQLALMGSAEYRLLFADRVHALMYNGGVLSVDSTAALWTELAVKLEPMVFAESARWGAYYVDYGASETVFGHGQWQEEVNRILTRYLTGTYSNRFLRFIPILQSHALYPALESPQWTKSEDGKIMTFTIPADSVVYYTTDGSDPRVAFEGVVAVAATIYEAGAEIALKESGIVKARALSTDGEWSALSEIDLEGSEPKIVKNEFIPTGNGENWDKDANWSEGAFPNEAGAWAVVGVPTAFKKDKGWRNIHINKTDVTVGHVEMTCGGCTNRVDTGKSGNLIFSGKLDAEGVPLEDATFVVIDEANPSLAMIDLDAPNKVILATDLEVVVSNTVGDVEYGGVLFKGLWEGNGHNLAKSGSGLMTLDVSNTPETAFAKIQVEEGSIAITKKVYAEAITKEGVCMAALGSTDLAEAVAKASELSDKVSVNDVRLFVPSYVGGSKYYGAFVAKNSLTTTNAKKGKYVSAYVRDMAGDVRFDGKAYRLIPDATIKTMTLEDGRMTYVVDVPEQDVSVYVGPDGKEVPADESTTTEDLIGKVRDRSKIIIKGSSEIVVNNDTHTLSVDGITYTMPEYYDAKIVGKWVQIAFNENARPEYAASEDGQSDVLVVCESDVSLGVKTMEGLKYTLQQRTSLIEGEWVDIKTIVGNGSVQRLECEKLSSSGFYRIVVED